MTASPWSDKSADEPPADALIVTTTNGIDGKPVQTYLGIVTGEVIVGANLFRDLFASVRDIVGGRSGAYEDVLARAPANRRWARCASAPPPSAPTR